MSPAEAKLRDEIGLGKLVRVTGDWPTAPDTQRPTEKTKDNTIRAEFIRYLMLDGCESLPKPVPETGVRVMGAWIEGVLNLEGARCQRDLALAHCHFDTAPVLRSAELDGLFLYDSCLPGLAADRLRLRGNAVFSGATTAGILRISGARIGGDLDCDGATLGLGVHGNALAADRAQVDGSVFLRHATSTGTLRLLGARIGGNLDCVGTKLGPGADGRALSGERAQVGGVLLWRDGAKLTGLLDLTGARIGSISDAQECWPTERLLLLNRCEYGALTGRNLDADARIHWLDLQDPARFGQDFWPQPWVHCAKVLREMGHRADAQQVLIAMEKRQRKARRARLWRSPQTIGDFVKLLISPIRWVWLWLFDSILALLIAYGHRPMRAFLFLGLLLAAGDYVFREAYDADQFKPNNAFVLRAPEWIACAPGYIAPSGQLNPPGPRNPEGQMSQVDCYEAQPEAASYPKFNALVYSADTLLPVVAMEMQEFWIPDETAGTRGKWTRVYLWVHIAMGWALSLLAVAGFSGLVRSDR